MEKITKESGKINLATILVTIVCIIIVVCAIIFVSKQNGKKVSKTNISGDLDISNAKTIDDYKKIAEEYKEFRELVIEDMGEDYVKELTTFDKVSKIVGEFNAKDYDDSYVENFSQNEIEEAVKKYLNLYFLANSNVPKLLVELNLAQDENVNSNEEMILDDYYVTNINFEDFKNEMLKYVTEEIFIDDFCSSIKSLDGKLCYSSYYMSDSDSLELKSLVKEDDSNNSYIASYVVKSVYIDTDDDNLEDEIVLNDNVENEEIEDDTNVENLTDTTASDEIEETSEYEDEIIVYITSKNNKPIIGYDNSDLYELNEE